MKPLSDYIGEKLVFVQPNFFKGLHEFKRNDELIARMQTKGFFGMRWESSIQNKNWEIYKPSIWKNTFEIREAGYELPIASFARERFKSRGTLSLPMGEILKIEPHLFKKFTEIKNVRDECLVRLKSKMSWKERAEVTIEKKSELIDKYPWTILLAYIIMLEQKQQAAHSAA